MRRVETIRTLEECRSCGAHVETVETEHGFHEVCKLKCGYTVVIIPHPAQKTAVMSVSCPHDPAV